MMDIETMARFAALVSMGKPNREGSIPYVAEKILTFFSGGSFALDENNEAYYRELMEWIKKAS